MRRRRRAQALTSLLARSRRSRRARKLLLPLCRGGRGVALASGAADALHARAPLDVANLARALGFRPEHAHARARRRRAAPRAVARAADPAARRRRAQRPAASDTARPTRDVDGAVEDHTRARASAAAL